jgi:hypothetical protein
MTLYHQGVVSSYPENEIGHLHDDTLEVEGVVEED